MEKLLLLTMLLPLFSFGQQPNASKDLLSHIAKTSLLGQLTLMEMNLDPAKVKGFSPKVISKKLGAGLEIEENKEIKKFGNKNLIKLQNYYNDIISFGDGMNKVYLFEPDSKVNFFSVLNSPSGLIFIQDGIISKTSYNTLKTDANSRANSIAKEIIIPSIANFEPLCSIEEVKNFCLIVNYEVKNFSKDYSNEGEALAILIPKSVVQNYSASKITDAQLVSKSTFYNVDKNSSGRVKKIAIKL